MCPRWTNVSPLDFSSNQWGEFPSSLRRQSTEEIDRSGQIRSDVRVSGRKDEESGSLGPVDNGENDRRAHINEFHWNSSFGPSTRLESETKSNRWRERIAVGQWCVCPSPPHRPIGNELSSTFSLRRFPPFGIGKRRTSEEILDNTGEFLLFL